MKSEREQRLYTGAAGASSALIGPDLVARAPQLLSYWTKNVQNEARDREENNVFIVIQMYSETAPPATAHMRGAQLQQRFTHEVFKNI